MKFRGLQKLTLLDYPGKTACTVFTGSCNLRCPFCHNSELVLTPTVYPEISEEEILLYLEKRKNTLDGICITGGEPLLWKDIPLFCEKVKALGVSVKLDTNGFFPDLLRYLVNSSLVDYVAMDLKNTFEKYPETVGIPALSVDRAVESFAFLKESALPHEFRTTLCRPFHTLDDVVTMARTVGKDQRYFLQTFKDSGSLIGTGVTGFTPQEMKNFKEAALPFAPLVEVRGSDV